MDDAYNLVDHYYHPYGTFCLHVHTSYQPSSVIVLCYDAEEKHLSIAVCFQTLCIHLALNIFLLRQPENGRITF